MKEEGRNSNSLVVCDGISHVLVVVHGIFALVFGRDGQTYCLIHSNNLRNKMGNSLLSVRGINHKYVIVEKKSNVSIKFAS